MTNTATFTATGNTIHRNGSTGTFATARRNSKGNVMITRNLMTTTVADSADMTFAEAAAVVFNK